MSDRKWCVHQGQQAICCGLSRFSADNKVENEARHGTIMRVLPSSECYACTAPPNIGIIIDNYADEDD